MGARTLSNATAIAVIAASLLAGCTADDSGQVPGDSEDSQPYAGIAESDVVIVGGTEPFWGARIEGKTLTYSTPEDIDGQAISVTRFAGRGGLSFSGELNGQVLDLAVTPGECNDGMSDRVYPFTATLRIGERDLQGCAHREGDDLGPPP